jgi:hypothetical protein
LKLKTFEKALTTHELYKGHDYTSRSVPRTLVTEVLSIDWIETIFLPHIAELRQQCADEGLTILVVDGYLTHVTHRAIALCGPWKIILIKLILHASHLAQSLDLCVVVLFKIMYRKEKQSKRLQEGTRKIYRARLMFSKSTIVLWSFQRPRFCLNPDNLLRPLTIDSKRLLNHLEVCEVPFDDAVVSPERLDHQQVEGSHQRRRHRILGPADFVITLITYIDATLAMSPSNPDSRLSSFLGKAIVN